MTELMNTFENTINYIRNIIRNEGVGDMDSINHCILFILCKYLNLDRCDKYNIDPKYSFDRFMIDDNNKEIEDPNRILEKFYNKKVDCLFGQICSKFNYKMDLKIENVSSIKNIYTKLKDLDIDKLDINFDIIGTIYEFHIKTGAKKQSSRDLGQYYTNRQLINYMIKLCDLKLNETILDPTCGTGGFLSMSIKYLNNKYNDIDWSSYKNNIFGFDIDNHVKNLTLLNLLLETNQLFKDTVCRQNTLYNDFSIINKVDVILANEPFGIKNIKYKDCCQKITDLKIEGTKGEPLFLQLMCQSLNVNGRCAVIVPDGVLNNDSNLHMDTRKYIIKNFNLKKVIMLNDSFFMNTGVKCAVLYFVNSEKKTTITEFIEIKFIDNQIKEDKILDVNIKELEKNNYNLNVKKYIINEDKKINGVEYMKLGDICEFKNGYCIKTINMSKNKDDYPVIKVKNLISQNAYLVDDNDYINIKLSDNYLIKKNDLLIVMVGNTSGKIAIWNDEKEAYLNQNIHKINICNEKIISKYLFYQLNKNYYQDILKDLSSGSAQPFISTKDIEEIKIPIPSIDIQKEIVEILDVYYEQIESNKKSIDNYEKIKKSIIWSNIINCDSKKLGDICQIKSGNHSTNKKDFIAGDYPIIGGGKNPIGYHNIYNCDENTILCASHGSAGYISIYPTKTFLTMCFAIIIKDLKYVKNKYLLYYLKNIENKIISLSNGSAQKCISMKNLQDINIPVPSIDIQTEIVEQCDYYDNQIDILKKEIIKLESNDVIDKVLKSLNKEN